MSLSPAEGSEVVFEVAGSPVTRAQALRAFKLVEPESHWKNPIEAVRSTREVGDAGGIAVIAAAVTFYTGSRCATFVRPDGTVLFRAAGYYAAVGA